MKEEIVVKIDGISKIYKLYDRTLDILKEAVSITGKKRHRDYYALNNISFEVMRGETFGIIGTNGAGKSTLLKIITGVTTASEGELSINGKISALLELGTGFNMEYTGIQNIYLNGTMMGFSKAEMKEKIQSILEFADIGEFIDQPVKTYSSGMFARLAFAVAINVEPEILIVDEALSVGDVFFQNKCYKKFEDMRSMGTTILFVSHDIHTVKQMCSRVLWIESGKMKLCGDSTAVCNAYTNSLLKKQGKSYSESSEGEEYAADFFDADNFPPISYTNESILNEEVKIISCFIKNSRGQLTNECVVKESYTLSVVVDSKIAIKDCIVGFVLETIKGQWIVNCNTAISGEEKPIKVGENSLTRVDFSFEMPSLMRGEYIIGAAVSKGRREEYKIITWLYNVLAVNIINDGNNSGVIDMETDISIYSNKR